MNGKPVDADEDSGSKEPIYVKPRGILARAAEKMKAEELKKQDDLTEEAMNDPNY